MPSSPSMQRSALLLLLSLTACAADRAQMTARAANENETARTNAERAFFGRGYKRLEPQPELKTLTLRGVNRECTFTKEHAATDPVELTLGDTAGTTTFEAACAVASGRKRELSLRLAGGTSDTLVTQIPPGYTFAVAASGAITRYLLVGQVKENRRGYEEGVSCCCNMDPPPPPDAKLSVVVGADPSTSEEVVTYDSVIVTFCDPKAPQ